MKEIVSTTAIFLKQNLRKSTSRAGSMFTEAYLEYVTSISVCEMVLKGHRPVRRTQK